jgi:hypothetical protein
LYGPDISQAVGGAWITEHVAPDNAAINWIDELVGAIGIGNLINQRPKNERVGTIRHLIIGRRVGWITGIERIGHA